MTENRSVDADGARLRSRLKALQDTERLVALGIDALHGALVETCDRINGRLTGGDAHEVLWARRWAYRSWVWFQGQDLLTLTYEMENDRDAPHVLARCRVAGDNGRLRTTITLMRAGPGAAEWRVGNRAPELPALFLALLEHEVEDRLKPSGGSS